MNLKPSFPPLALGMQGADVVLLQQALRALGLAIPVAERANGVAILGPETVAVVKALQTDLKLPPTGVLDASTVRLINDRLNGLATASRTVRGTVKTAVGAPFAGGVVRAFVLGPAGERPLARPVPLQADASYELTYAPPAETNGRIDLRLDVVDATGRPVETTPSGASVLPNAGTLEVVDFVVTPAAAQAAFEFQTLLADVRPFLGTRALADLTERDAGLLAIQSGYGAGQIAALVAAHRFARETGGGENAAAAAAFYALARQRLSPEVLSRAHAGVLRSVVRTAVERGLVPAEVDGRKIEDQLVALAPSPKTQVGGLLGSLLNPAQLDTFVAKYQKSANGPDTFWKSVAADPALAAKAAELKLTCQLLGLTLINRALVDRVRPQIKHASDLARFSKEEWKTFIRAHEDALPLETPGNSQEAKIEAYAQRIVEQVEAAFPNGVFAARLDPSPVKEVLTAFDFDVAATYPAKFLNDNPAAAEALGPGGRKQLEAYRRLHGVTSRKSVETIALFEKGFASAEQISRTDAAVFARRMEGVLSPERAQQIHARALGTSALAQALWVERFGPLNRTALHALPAPSLAKQVEGAAAKIPDWQTLFGGLDFCACEDCASAHGAAAYFVDTLHFLDQRDAKPSGSPRTAKDVLFGRRSDLGDIELSCENTNTALPLIDLVNEVLEDAVAPPPAFAPLSLPAALEPDLAQPLATDAVSAAFTPPLRPGTRIETLEGGRRWRISDEPFSYAVVKDGAALNVTARSRQTSGGAAERRATPQYRNSAAYAALSDAVFPGGLPFDLPSQEAAVFLGHLGVSRRELIEALRPVPEPFDPGSALVIELASERLGLTDVERRIIVGAPLVPPQPPEAFWGGVDPQDPATLQDWLDRFGLAYADLDVLVATAFVNPDGAARIVPAADAPVDTCDTSKLRVDGLTIEVLGRLHRFLRLQRALGWKVPELDRALRALATDPSAPDLNDALLVRLDLLRATSAKLRLSVAQTLALWRPIDTAEPGSLYDRLFHDPSLSKATDEAFRLRADRQELLALGGQLTDHAVALQAIFRLGSADLTLLIGITDGALTLENLSAIYRRSALARQVKLGVADLQAAIELTGIDPFRADRSQDTLRFIEVVEAIKASGFGVARLDYLLRHRFNPPSPFVPSQESLLQILTDIHTGLGKVDATSDADLQAQRRSAIIDRTAAALELPADVTAGLLDRVRNGVVDRTAMQVLVELSAIAAGPLVAGDVAAALETLEKLSKVSSVIRTLDLLPSQLDWLFRENPWLALAPDPPAAPVPFADWSSLIELPRVRRDLGLGAAALEAVLDALDTLGTVAGASDAAATVVARRAFVVALTQWLGWAEADVETLIGRPEDPSDLGLLQARVPDDYRGVGLLARLGGAVSLLKRLGVTAAEATLWCEAEVTETDARAIRAAAKAKHDRDAWQTVVGALEDGLREKRRQALVSYLVARPQLWAPDLSNPTASDLFSRFLIDVEMCSCQNTSRIKQAIASVQLFAQRALLGLEPEVDTADSKWGQWAWMKSFRVWEANRKIWLYPENWIEPELRDDKTPFFKDLETELLQSDLDATAAEQALLHYLEKLDVVGQLEIAGIYEDEDKTLHVIGRTFHTPRAYYYRRRTPALSWTPWEKVDLDIEGDHLIPVVWHRKLHLFWPLFTEKQKQKDAVMPAPGGALQPGDPYWEIQLAWSEYQRGRWMGKNLSEPVTFAAYQGEDDLLFGEGVARRLPDTAVFRPANPIEPDPDDPEIDPGDGGGGGNGTGGGTTEVPPRGSGSNGPRKLVAKELISWKGLLLGDTLALRAYLRLDYHAGADAEERQLAYPVGEFRLSGCRKLVATSGFPLIRRRHFSLAPRGTKLDHMWFTQTAGGLTLYDGTFPAAPPVIISPDVTGPFGPINEPASIAAINAQPTLAQKLDIPVFGATQTLFRLLAPHQDLQFVADRPFAFMDGRRAFLGSSTRAETGTAARVDSAWLDANLATMWRADYFQPRPAAPDEDGATNGTPTNGTPTNGATSMTVLVRGPGGTRVARTLPPISIGAPAPAVTLLPTFHTTREYRFTNFHHPYTCDFIKALATGGLPALLSLETQSARDPQSFDAYQPGALVLDQRPVDEIEFGAGGAYEIYNWELFFHVPLLIATRLSTNQRFQEAQRWFHFIFDPTGASGDEIPRRYWRFAPFNQRLAGDYEAESVKVVEELVAKGASPELMVAVEAWRANPFNPHAVARLRTTAFQKNVVMKYLDNLIAWGDQLFRRETLESINEATQLYVLAAEILGRRPEVIARKVKPRVETFNTLGELGALSNTLEQIELLVGDGGDATPPEPTSETPDPPTANILYFCVPENDELLAYWSTVADRLFKIRHCMNIEGQVRQLPLFEPPIDPALLVRAQAAGLSIGDVLNEISNVSLPNYRFAVVLQKANEVLGDVRSLAAALLSTLEKRDAEALSTLRSGQELRLLQTIRDIRVNQVAEASKSIEALQRAKELAQARKDYYDGREFMSSGEDTARQLAEGNLGLLATSAVLRGLGAALVKFGNLKIGGPTTAGTEIGPAWVGTGLGAAAAALEVGASIASITSQLTGQMAEYERRQDEWDHQVNLATIELKQIDQQLAAAEIRLAIVERELASHDQQVDNARAIDELLRTKYTNQDLYQTMIGDISGVYFQSYQLAYDLAKRAEKCMQHELGLTYGETSFIRFGYWDSLKKGLLAGDHLAHDLKRLDVAYLDRNVREYELTRHVSLVALAPEQLIALKETGACEFEVPEWVFDLETPGHFARRLKSASVTIPCVTGPYTSVSCKVQLTKSSYRQSRALAVGYDRLAPDDPGAPDVRFVDDRKILDAIVTSTGQADAGLFEPTMRDERYLPFEGAGAISRWRLELPMPFKPFDYGSISDVVLHLRYTAREGGEELRQAATDSVTDLLGDADARPLVRLFSLRHEFPSEWRRLTGGPAAAMNAIGINLSVARFPYFVQGREVTVQRARVLATSPSTPGPEVRIVAGDQPSDLDGATSIFPGPASPGLWTIGTTADPKTLDDVFVILEYTVGASA